MCETKKTRLSSENAIGKPAADLMVARMNENLLGSNETAGCAPLELNPEVEITVDEFVDEDADTKIYRVSFTTIPGDGEFWGFVLQKTGKGKGFIEILSEKFPRLNSYAAQAKCALTSTFASYCYCTDSGKATTTTSDDNVYG